MSSCNKGVDKGRKKSYAAPASGSIEKTQEKTKFHHLMEHYLALSGLENHYAIDTATSASTRATTNNWHQQGGD